jgi:hypothetical protein
LKSAAFEEFEDQLRELSLSTQIPLQSLPVILGDIAGVLMQEARTTLFEDREEVTVDPQRVREELVRMGHDGDGLDLHRVRLLVDFFLERMVDPDASRN